MQRDGRNVTVEVTTDGAEFALDRLGEQAVLSFGGVWG
jgi:hypothetical protein